MKFKMATHMFILFFCALFLVSAHALQNTNQLKEDTKLIDLIKKIVNKIEETLDKVISKATAVIEGISDDWEGYRGQIIDVWAGLINAVLNKIIKVVDRIAEHSTDTGKTLAKCFDTYAADLGAVPITLLNLTTECMTNDLITVVKSLGPLVNDLAGIQEDAKKVADKIDDCQGDDIQGFLCVVQVGADLLKVAAQIPEKVKADIPPIMDDIKKLINTTIRCAKSNLDPNADKVLDEIATCAGA